MGKTIEDKYVADRVFLNNMLRAVRGRPWYLQAYGEYIAKKYYDAVDVFGTVAYWEGKNSKESMRKV